MASSATDLDRKALATTMINDHPTWSDRVIADRSGASATAVAALRADGGSADGATYRIGRDGRHRPRDPIVGRRRAAELLHANPDLTLKALAEAAGIAMATAKDVRDRLSRGLDPVPEGLRRHDGAGETAIPPSAIPQQGRSGEPFIVELPVESQEGALERSLANAVAQLAGPHDPCTAHLMQRREVIVALAIRCGRLCEEFAEALSDPRPERIHAVERS